MIKTALVAMTVMGCDCDAKVCEYVGKTPAQWTSVAECQTAMKAQIEKRRDLNYPVISGVCEPVAGSTEMLALQIPPASPSPNAIVPITPDPQRQDRQGRVSQLYSAAIDGGRVVFRKSSEGYVLVRTGIDRAADGAVALVRWTASSLIPGR
jgi:hypothetical protein